MARYDFSAWKGNPDDFSEVVLMAEVRHTGSKGELTNHTQATLGDIYDLSRKSDAVLIEYDAAHFIHSPFSR
jgi:hypothetical protein